MRPHIRSAFLGAAVCAAIVLSFAPSAQAAPSVPGAPTITSAYSGPSRATVKFDAPADDGGSAITSYSAACSSTDGGVANSAPGNDSPITVTGLTPGATYTCVVAAVNDQGQGPDSEPSGSIVPDANTAPAEPSITNVVPQPGALVVNVFASDDGGDPITTYNADCTSGDGGSPNNASDVGPTVTVAGLTSGHWYSCTATVANSIGTSAPSGWSGPFLIPDPPASGAIAGTVTASPAADLTGYCAQATYTNWDNVIANTSIAPDGTYEIGGLATGDYAVRFVDCTGGGDYLPQWYDGRLARPNGDPSRDGATNVSVTDGATTTGINGSLTLGAHITGTVTDTNGDPLTNVCIGALVQFDAAAMTNTHGDGTYDLLVPPGTSMIGFFDCGSGHNLVTQFWDHTDKRVDATELTVEAGTTTAGIDATMVAGGSIEGFVTDGSGDPIGDVCVTPTNGNIETAYRTGSDGYYHIGPLLPGDHTLAFVDCSTNATHGGTTRSATVASDEVTTLDVVLADEAPGTIAGHLTTEYGTPLEGVCVAVLTGFAGEPRFAGPTGPDGSYEVANLGTGDYFVGFFGCNGDSPTDPIPDPLHPGVTYSPQWYSNAPLGANPDPYGDGGTQVTVRSGQTTVVNECFEACNTAIVITDVVPGDGSITISFEVNGPSSAGGVSAQAIDEYTASCTSGDGGVPGEATGPDSPITVTGLTNGVTYVCTVSFTDGRAVYSAATPPVVVGAANADSDPGVTTTPGGGALAFTGAQGAAQLVLVAFALIIVGAAAVAVTRKRRAHAQS